MQLFGASDSGHSYKVRSFLLLSHTPHDYQWVDLSLARAARGAAFVAASKFGEVPVLLDDGQALCQSNSILFYLANKCQKLCGTAGESQRILEWLFWETNRIGFSVPNLRFALRFVAQPEEVLHYLRQRAKADLLTLDQFLARSQFLLPSGPSIADISCSAYLFWLPELGLEHTANQHVQRWWADIHALRGWQHP